VTTCNFRTVVVFANVLMWWRGWDSSTFAATPLRRISSCQRAIHHSSPEFCASGGGWRRGWDSNPVSPSSFSNLQILNYQRCRRCQGYRGALHAVGREVELHTLARLTIFVKCRRLTDPGRPPDRAGPPRCRFDIRFWFQEALITSTIAKVFTRPCCPRRFLSKGCTKGGKQRVVLLRGADADPQFVVQ
jgi:hypothetical protein